MAQRESLDDMRQNHFISVLWVLFALALTSIWKYFPEKEVDWFILINEKQSIQWYVFDTTEMIKQIIFLSLIYKYIKVGVAQTLMSIIIWYSVLRVFDYYLWREMYDALLEVTFGLIIVFYVGYKLIYKYKWI